MELRIKGLYPDINFVEEKIFPYSLVAKEFFVLRGNFDVMKTISKRTKHKNKAYLLIFDYFPGECPFFNEIDDSLTLFEELAFAGMNPSRFPYLAVVIKTAKGRVVVYIVGLTLDLRTGKYYNPVPPNWKPYYKLLEDYLNARYGYRKLPGVMTVDGEVVPSVRCPEPERANKILDELKKVINRHAAYNQERYHSSPTFPVEGERFVYRTKIEDVFLPFAHFEKIFEESVRDLSEIKKAWWKGGIYYEGDENNRNDGCDDSIDVLCRETLGKVRKGSRIYKEAVGNLIETGGALKQADRTVAEAISKARSEGSAGC